jgi:hypothetical protein
MKLVDAFGSRELPSSPLLVGHELSGRPGVFFLQQLGRIAIEELIALLFVQGAGAPRARCPRETQRRHRSEVTSEAPPLLNNPPLSSARRSL